MTPITVPYFAYRTYSMLHKIPITSGAKINWKHAVIKDMPKTEDLGGGSSDVWKVQQSDINAPVKVPRPLKKKNDQNFSERALIYSVPSANRFC